MVLLKQKLRNAVLRYGSEFDFELKNILVNGQKRGCSGFITNLQNGVTVFVNTEKSVYQPLSNKVLVRYARDVKDFGGSHSHNTYVNYADIAAYINTMLNDKSEYDLWIGEHF